MAQAKFLLSVPNHCSTINWGLRFLQQNNEFVDMTLAADGHLVKVHQFLMALASPYLKELIQSVQCPHPVIFLNKISYDTLCSILQYVYTGEVHVSPDNIKDVLEAAQSLHIIGLQSMDVTGDEFNVSSDNNTMQDDAKQKEISSINKEYTHMHDQITHENDDDYSNLTEHCSDTDVTQTTSTLSSHVEKCSTSATTAAMKHIKNNSPLTVQYTMSNRGSLQIICNRYLYFPFYTYKDKSNLQRWRCVDFRNAKCPAHIITKDNIVVKRIRAHSHPFHDRRICKKMKNGWVFSAIQEAETVMRSQRNPNNQNDDHTDDDSSVTNSTSLME